MNNDILDWGKEFERSIPVEQFQEISNCWWIDCYNRIEEFLLTNIELGTKSKILESGSGSGNSS